MYSEYGHKDDDYIAVLYPVEHDETFLISFHHGEMPAFDSKSFDTLTEAKKWAKRELGITRWRGYDGRFVATPD